MTVYEALNLMIGFSMLVVTIMLVFVTILSLKRKK